MSNKNWHEVSISYFLNRDYWCPKCASSKESIRIKYFGDKVSRRGYAVMWCDNCKNGSQLPSLSIRDGLEVFPRDSENVNIPSDIVIGSEGLNTEGSPFHK